MVVRKNLVYEKTAPGGSIAGMANIDRQKGEWIRKGKKEEKAMRNVVHGVGGVVVKMTLFSQRMARLEHQGWSKDVGIYTNVRKEGLKNREVPAKGMQKG